MDVLAQGLKSDPVAIARLEGMIEVLEQLVPVIRSRISSLQATLQKLKFDGEYGAKKEMERGPQATI